MEKSDIVRFAVVLVAPFISARTCVCSGAPKLVFEKSVIDLGETREDDGPEIQFKFSNKGDQPLMITEIRGSCKCHALKLSKETLLPGESGFLFAKISTRYRFGPLTDQILVKSNDPKNPKQVLRIKQYVVKRTLAVPDRLYIDLSENSASLRTIRILGPNNYDTFKVVELKTSVGQVVLGKPRYKSKSKEGRCVWEFTLETKHAAGRNVAETGNIEILTNDNERPVLKIPLTLLEDIPIKIYPRTLTFVLRGQRPPESKHIQVLWRRASTDEDTDLVIGPVTQHVVNILSEKTEKNSKEWLVDIKPPVENKVAPRVRRNDILLLFPQIDIELTVPVIVIDVRDVSSDSTGESTDK
jgi:hypothetical protein